MEVLLVLALEFVVEDDAGHAAALALDPRRFGAIGRRELGVVAKLARLDDFGVERLLAPVGSGMLVGLEQALAVSSQREHMMGAGLIDDGLAGHEALVDQMPARALGGIGQVMRRYDAEGAGCRQDTDVVAIEPVVVPAKLDHLALVALRQIEVARGNVGDALLDVGLALGRARGVSVVGPIKISFAVVVSAIS